MTVPDWRQELATRLAEQKARLMVKMANRTFKRNPSTMDRLAIRAVEKAAGGKPRAMEDDLRHD